MPSPNLPPGFDFTDPDIYAERLPIEELAEMRKVAPIWWNEQPKGRRRVRRRRLLGGDQAQGRQGGVAAQRRVLQQREDRVAAVPRRGRSRSRSRQGKVVLLNMDAPHHTQLRKIISRGVHPARHRVACARSSRERAQNIAKAAAAEGSGDFVEQVSCELPLQAIAGLLGVPQEDRDKLFDWSNQMTGGDGPRVRRRRPARSRRSN